MLQRVTYPADETALFRNYAMPYNLIDSPPACERARTAHGGVPRSAAGA